MNPASPPPDRDLRQRVLDGLEREPSIRADGLRVDVTNGVVTLSGRTQSYLERWTAEHVAQRVAGVQGVRNETQVELEDAHKKDDAALSAAVQNVLDWTTSLSTESITAFVKDGWVTLDGTVNWQFQRVAVNNAVRHLTGVLGLIDEICVSPAVSQDVVRGDLEAALRRAAAKDAQRIAVEVDGSQVTLTGSVNSWAEHTAATTAAWNSPGVTDVVDKLTVVY